MSTEADLDTDSEPAMLGSTQQVNNDDLLGSNVRSMCSTCTSSRPHGFRLLLYCCGQSTYLSSLVSKYKDSGALALKNSLERLQGFMQQVCLHYSCQRCADSFNFSSKSINNVHKEFRMGNSDMSSGTFTVEQQILHNEVISVKSSLQVMSGCLSQITQQMNELKSTLQSLPDTLQLKNRVQFKLTFHLRSM